MLAGLDFQTDALEAQAQRNKHLWHISTAFQKTRERIRQECRDTIAMFRARCDHIENLLNVAYNSLYESASPRLKKQIEAGYQRKQRKEAKSLPLRPQASVIKHEDNIVRAKTDPEIEFGFREEDVDDRDLFA